jgi:hypothetical protein
MPPSPRTTLAELDVCAGGLVLSIYHTIDEADDILPDGHGHVRAPPPVAHEHHLRRRSRGRTETPAHRARGGRWRHPGRRRVPRVVHVDLAQCARRGVVFTGADKTFSIDVADHVVGLFISVFRRVVTRGR